MSLNAVDATRIVLGLIFTLAGAAHFPSFDLLRQSLAAKGLPMPSVLLSVASLLQMALGVLFITNVMPQSTSVALSVFTVGSSVLMLDFWKSSGMVRELKVGGFVNNVGLVAAMLLVGHLS